MLFFAACRAILLLISALFVWNHCVNYYESFARVGVGKLLKLEDGRKINYICQGAVEKPLVLCLHGAFDSFLRFHDIMLDLARDHRVCAWNRAGRGFSDPSEDADRASLALSDMDQLLQHLKRSGEANTSQYILIGHSLGAVLSIAHAQRAAHGVVKDVVLLDPPPLIRDMGDSPIFRKLHLVWTTSFPLFTVLSTLGLFRIASYVYGFTGYWFDTLSTAPSVRSLQARQLNCPTYFRAAQRDVLKGIDATALVYRQHDAVAPRRADFDLLRVHSDYTDLHDVAWANLTRAELREFLLEQDANDAIWSDVLEPKSATQLRLPNSTHVFLSLQADETLRIIRRFLGETNK